MPLTSFLHRKNNLPLPLPPLDPPPSVEKRQEKEKAWLASIYDRKGKSSSSSSSKNKDAQGLGYTHQSPAAAGGGRNHARSRTADSVLTTASVGRSSASTKSGLLTISSRWRQSSSRPASVVSSDNADDTLQRNIATLQVPRSSGPPATVLAPTISSSTASSPSLAQRLEQLSQAHAQGLLDDEEYRVLRGNLFESSLKKPPLPGDDILPSAGVRTGGGRTLSHVGEGNEGAQTTGALLGLPRLVPIQNSTLGELDLRRVPSFLTRADLLRLSPYQNSPVPSAPPTAVDGLTNSASQTAGSQHLLPVPFSSADSVRSGRTRSKLSVRSSKSAISLRSRITSLLPSSKHAEASSSADTIHGTTTDEVETRQETTLKRKPSFLGSAKSALTFKPSTMPSDDKSSRVALPADWTTTNGPSHTAFSPIVPSSPSAAGRRSSHLSTSALSSSSATSFSQVIFQPMNASSSLSAAQAGPSSLLLDESHQASTEYLRNSLASQNGLPRRSISEDNAMHSLSTLSPLHPVRQSTSRDRSSTLLSSASTRNPTFPTSSSTHDAHLKFSVMQAEDDLLDAEGLRKAIQKVEMEQKNVSEQFAQLEKDMLANLGRSTHTASSVILSPGRSRPGLGSPRDSGKRSIGSSSSSILGDSTSRSSLAIPSGLPASLSRRPSLANSVQSQQSTSSSLLSPSSSRFRPSNIPYEAEDEELALSFAMSPASKGGRHRLEESSDSTESIEGDDKLLNLQEKRKNVEMRYDARLEYLHAKLVARELKEKLRR